MAKMLNPIEEIEEVVTNRFVVIHPLDDLPEQKVDTDRLGPMPMTTSVRVSLMSLRAYLVVMMLMVLYHVLGLAGLFR